jgi:hypothetical protein
MAEDLFVVDSARNARRHRGRHRQHLAFSAILIATAIGHLFGEHHGSLLLPIAMLLSGLAVIGTMVLEHRRKHHDHHQGLAWAELAGVIMSVVETIEKIQGHHRIGYIALSFAGPAVMAYIAWHTATGRPGSYMKVDDEAFEVRRRLMRPKRRIRWAQVTAVRIDGDNMDVLGRSKRLHRIDLKDIRNRSEAVQWASEQFVRRGVTIESGAAQ